MFNKYGLKIFNYEAASIYGRDDGTKESYYKKEALFANSLFSEFLESNGLKRWKNDKDGGWTRDIIGVNFSFNYKDDKNKGGSKSREELRRLFYANGLAIKYSDKEIKYKMLYRTAGKAKEGSCVFICERLYKKALGFLRMDKPELLKEKSRLVELAAYQALAASGIVGTVAIDPQKILVIDDVESFCARNVVSVSELIKALDGGAHKGAAENFERTAKVSNVIFDGQALIDRSIFERSKFFDEKEKPNGFILLRQRFFKAAAFCVDIQQFFKDYCSDHKKDYDTFTVQDRWGRKLLAKNVQLITTQNAAKWTKFGDSLRDFEHWQEQVAQSGSTFGIVKTAHKSKQGDFQRMSYQMVNALESDVFFMQNVAGCSLDYVKRLKTADTDLILDRTKRVEDNDFIKFLAYRSNFYNDCDLLVELCKRNRQFFCCDYFRKRKKAMLSDYVNHELRAGRIIQNADNLVIVGSPYAMLLAAAGDNPFDDPMFKAESGPNAAIQCYTERFADGDELAEFRSPFNCRNNLGFLRNVHPPKKIKKYFEGFGEQIIAVNMLGTDFQARNNGSDQDSDFIYVTGQSDIVACAKKFYKEYPTIVNDIPENESDGKSKSAADVDIKLAAAKDTIGKSSNLSQLCLTYSYNNPQKRQELENYVCILSVLAQIAIDEAKHDFDVDIKKLMGKIRGCVVGENKKIYPDFWNVIWERNGKEPHPEKIDHALGCPMNYVYNLDFADGRSARGSKGLGLEEFFVQQKKEGASNRRTPKEIKAIEKIIEAFGLEELKSVAMDDGDDDKDDEQARLRLDFETMLKDVRAVCPRPSAAICSALIDRAFCITAGQKRNAATTKRKTDKNKSLLLKVLYTLNPAGVLSCFKTEKQMDGRL